MLHSTTSVGVAQQLSINGVGNNSALRITMVVDPGTSADITRMDTLISESCLPGS